MAGYSHTNTALYLVDPNRSTKYRVGQWLSFSAEKAEHDAGPLTITAPMDAPWITSAAAGGFDVYDAWEFWSFDFYVNNFSSPAYSGPIVARGFTPGPALGCTPLATLTCETFWQHFTRRRANSTSANADAVNAAVYPENIVRGAYRNALGTVTPTGYPGGVSRSDMSGTAAYWTVTGASDSGTSSPTLNVYEQSGKSLQLYAVGVAEKGDLYLYASETSAATWQLTTSRPYSNKDATGNFVLTPYAGSITSYKLEQTLLELLNVVGMKGDGSNTGQVKGWREDGVGSVNAHGVYEGEATLPAASSTTYTNTEADGILNLQADPAERVTVSLRDVTGAAFNAIDAGSSAFYTHRTQIRFYLPTIGATIDAIVRGWKASQSGTGDMVVEAQLGNLTASINKQAARRAGWIGPFMSGDRWGNSDG